MRARLEALGPQKAVGYVLREPASADWTTRPDLNGPRQVRAKQFYASDRACPGAISATWYRPVNST
jgi:hypothetical protein